MHGRYPSWLKQRVSSDVGHLSNGQAGTYLSKVIGDRTKKVILAHLSEVNNTPDIALKTVKTILNRDITIEIALQNESLDVGEI